MAGRAPARRAYPGGYRTPRRGSGLDFAGIRPYEEGDDARHIDWNVTARLDEPQVREFNEDRELTTWLVLDRSASAAVGGPGRGKQDVLAELPSFWPGCSAETATGSAQSSTTSLATEASSGDERRRRHHPHRRPAGTGRGHALRIGRELDRVADSRAAATTDLAAMLDTVASLARRCLVVVISDFIGTGEWQRPLIRLAHETTSSCCGWSTVRTTRSLRSGLIVVEDAETGEQLLVDSADPWFRARFRDGVDERAAGLRTGMRWAGGAPRAGLTPAATCSRRS